MSTATKSTKNSIASSGSRKSYGASASISSSSRGGTATSSAMASSSAFTAELRDRQARGKDPYGEEDSDFRLGAGYDTFPEEKEKEFAAQVLADREMLMMWAISRNDSMAGTQLYFTRKLYGLPELPPQSQSSSSKPSSSKSSSSPGKSGKSSRSRRSGSHH